LRPTEHNLFISMAAEVGRRSNCIRRAVGAVIVLEGRVIAEGWNGVSSGVKDCREAGCLRCIDGGETGSGYESCICIHAEQHAIADAAKRGVITNDSVLYVNLRPCLQCLVIARASGIREIFYGGEMWNYSSGIEATYRAISDQFSSFTRIAEQGEQVDSNASQTASFE
jgi:dCMP deaminase